jgi:hypothetical protein
MQQVSIKSQIVKEVDVLPLDLQKKVLDFIKLITDSTTPRGVSGKRLMNIAGLMTEDEADELSQIIEDGCERIDYNEW